MFRFDDQTNNYHKQDYSVITLDSKTANISSVSELVMKQVGFAVQLLDSKCIPITSSESTSSIDFWKSNRKIFAVSKTAYERKKFPSETLEGTCTSSQTLKKVNQINSQLEKCTVFVLQLSKNFECIICKAIANRLVIHTCCQGCETCVSRWTEEHSNCPRCSADCDLSHKKDLMKYVVF